MTETPETKHLNENLWLSVWDPKLKMLKSPGQNCHSALTDITRYSNSVVKNCHESVNLKFRRWLVDENMTVFNSSHSFTEKKNVNLFT